MTLPELSTLEELLEATRKKLLEPTVEAKRKLVITMNIVFIVAAIAFLSLEKVAEGHFVPQLYLLYYVYIPAILLNAVSLIYNLSVLKSVRKHADLGYKLNDEGRRRLDLIFGWGSMGAIMFMSFCNMIGVGNPSDDAILTDFALAHSLIVVAVIVVGRKGATIWFLIVIGTLIYVTSAKGLDYQYHYMTPSEVTEYEQALATGEIWAQERQRELNASGLNPPKITRYFNIWIIFITVSYLTAYFFSGITLDLLKRMRPVIRDIEKATAEGLKIKAEQEKLEREIEQKAKEITKAAIRIRKNGESLERIMNGIEKLDLKTQIELKPVIKIIREELNEEVEKDWEVFNSNFDIVHDEFFKKIKAKYPDLSQTENMYLAYIKLNMPNQEIAKMLGKSVDSLRMARFRLKKKLKLDGEEELSDLVHNL